MKEYKISELANILGISEQAIRSKVKRNILPSVQRNIDNREVTLVPLDNTELNNLVNTTNRNKNIYPINNTIPEQFTENIKPTIAEPQKQGYDQDLVFEYLREKDNKIDNIYQMLLQNQHNIGAMEKQIFLLEDSERSKENGYLKEIALLKAENERLKAENDQLKKGWKFWKK